MYETTNEPLLRIEENKKISNISNNINNLKVKSRIVKTRKIILEKNNTSLFDDNLLKTKILNDIEIKDLKDYHKKSRKKNNGNKKFFNYFKFLKIFKKIKMEKKKKKLKRF
jgi:hypothetical protein